MVYIIGSGLSAMAAAAALVQRGRRPTILDPGLSPDPEALMLKSKLAAVEPENWNSGDMISIRRTGPVARNGIPRKLFFGSDFAFRNIDPLPQLDLANASMYRSFAAGGFSNVWGAVIQPLPAEEFRCWPVSSKEMEPCYAAVGALIRGAPVSSAEPPPSANMPELSPSSQAKALYADLSAGRHDLASRGIRFSFAQIAVRTAGHNGNRGCCYCGLCLHGCPYECMYTASSTLAQLLRDDKIRYLRGVAVDQLGIENGHILIQSRSLHDSSPQLFRGRRVLVAAGFLESSRIILSSLRLRDIPFQIRHSDIFTLPMFRYSAADGVTKERLHTLCQLIVQIEDPAICARPVHLQLYGYNSLSSDLMRQKLGILGSPLAPLLRALESRLLVIFGYLHSSVSSSIILRLTGDREPRLRLEGRPNAFAANIGRAVTQKLFRSRRHFRAVPLGFALRLDEPGGGYHSGGVFPMRAAPGAFETDRLGSLASLPGVHIVDTSVFPEIPSAPTAFTAMANAYRIASEIELPNAE